MAQVATGRRGQVVNSKRGVGSALSSDPGHMAEVAVTAEVWRVLGAKTEDVQMACDEVLRLYEQRGVGEESRPAILSSE